MVNEKFAREVIADFDELGYRPSGALSVDDFLSASSNILLRAESLEEARLIIEMMDDCLRNWKKIEKAYRKHHDLFLMHGYGGPYKRKLIDKERAKDVYWLTNGIYGKSTLINLISHNGEASPISSFAYDGTSFFIKEKGKYRLKNMALSIDKMSLLNQEGKLLCDIVIGKDGLISLDHNLTPYRLKDGEGVIKIFDGQKEEEVASIEKGHLGVWREHLGIARLTLLKEADIEMLLFFAVASFLLHINHLQEQKGKDTLLYNMIMNS